MAGGMLVLIGCVPETPPCFDGTYEVEFLERLPESDCEEPWASGWRFVVEPISVTTRPEVCRSVSLNVIGHPPPRAIGPAVASVVFPYPVVHAGPVENSVDGDSSDCKARTDLGAMFPDTGYTNIAEAARDDAVIWGVYVNDITNECGTTTPNGGGCSEFYRSRMIKVADWAPE